MTVWQVPMDFGEALRVLDRFSIPVKAVMDEDTSLDDIIGVVCLVDYDNGPTDNDEIAQIRCAYHVIRAHGALVDSTVGVAKTLAEARTELGEPRTGVTDA